MLHGHLAAHVQSARPLLPARAPKARVGSSIRPSPVPARGGDERSRNDDVVDRGVVDQVVRVPPAVDPASGLLRLQRQLPVRQRRQVALLLDGELVLGVDTPPQLVAPDPAERAARRDAALLRSVGAVAQAGDQFGEDPVVQPSFGRRVVVGERLGRAVLRVDDGMVAQRRVREGPNQPVVLAVGDFKALQPCPQLGGEERPIRASSHEHQRSWGGGISGGGLHFLPRRFFPVEVHRHDERGGNDACVVAAPFVR